MNRLLVITVIGVFAVGAVYAMQAAPLLLGEGKENTDQIGGLDSSERSNAIEITKKFVVSAPTFKFDGIPETLNVTGVEKIDKSFQVHYIVIITFESRSAGYGDRTGQILAQVITPHRAVISIADDKVISAVLDGRWDELRQQSVPEVEQMTTDKNQSTIIYGKVTIGPLCPVEPCSAQQDVYSSREVILQPELGNPFRVRLNSDGTFQVKVGAGIYVIDLTDCTYLGCKTALPKVVKVELNAITNVEINIDTGIR
jgi:hypothetical protein